MKSGVALLLLALTACGSSVEVCAEHESGLRGCITWRGEHYIPNADAGVEEGAEDDGQPGTDPPMDQ